MPARSSVAKASHTAPLSRFATNGGEKCGLVSVLHKQNPDRTLIRATIVIPGGPDRHIRKSTVIEITNSGDRSAEVIISIQVAIKSPRFLGNLLPGINAAVCF
jgi:hypothetical protein